VAPGNLTRVAPDGTRTAVGGGKLMFPAGTGGGRRRDRLRVDVLDPPVPDPEKSHFRGAGGQVVKVTGLEVRGDGRGRRGGRAQPRSTFEPGTMSSRPSGQRTQALWPPS
jgi:hypothetical protein